MAYRITAFGGVTITPTGMDIGRSEIRDPYAPTISGVFDTLGTNRARQDLPRLLPVRAQVEATSAAALKTAWDSVLALHGTSGTLTRTSDSAVAHTISARCRRIQADRTPHDRFRIPYIIEFDLLADVWDGAAHTETITLDASPKSQDCDNDGNGIVRAVTITVTASGSPITAVIIENLEKGHVSKIKYAGSIAVGQSLVIDCGATTIRNNGVNAYTMAFTLESGHSIREWLRLMPGANTIRVTRTGGDNASTCVLTYNDGWV